MVGLLVLVLAYYYVQAARHEMLPFFRWTVHSRSLVMAGFIALVALGLAQPMLIVFGLVDLLGAIWTGLALRSLQA